MDKIAAKATKRIDPSKRLDTRGTGITTRKGGNTRGTLLELNS